MANYYSDPTANAAVSSIEKEMKSMTRLADKIAARYVADRISPEEMARAERQFTGIYRNLLNSAIFKAEQKAKEAAEKAASSTPSGKNN